MGSLDEAAMHGEVFPVLILVAWEVSLLLSFLYLSQDNGTHRFTAGFVAGLIVNGFGRRHGLLNTYVEYFTHLSVTDAQTFVEAEGLDALPNISQYKLDFPKLKKSEDSFFFLVFVSR